MNAKTITAYQKIEIAIAMEWQDLNLDEKRELRFWLARKLDTLKDGIEHDESVAEANE